MAASTFSLSLTKWSLDVVSRFIKADVRLHNQEAIQPGTSCIFVVNHFTRLETILLPYTLFRHTGLKVWGLAAEELFQGTVGQFLRAMGSVSTGDPDRDKIIIRALLTGEHPWMIFPEGAMIKDKKVVDHRGEFSIYSNGKRRPPHTGAASLALRAEFCRHKLQCLFEQEGQEGLQEALAHFELDSADQVLNCHTVIIPVNITYFPIRAHDNPLLRMANRFSEDLSERALEELSVEGTVLSEETDVDIVLGDPMEVREYLREPQYAKLMQCGLHDVEALEADTRSHFNHAARKLMLRYMRAIYDLSTVNYDHIFATIIRHQQAREFTERAYRNRIFLAARRLVESGACRMHHLLENTYRDIVYEDPSPKFHDFMSLCLQEKLIERDGDRYLKNFGLQRGAAGFHSVRFEELTEVIANEIEPLGQVTATIKRIARMPRTRLSQRIRAIFLQEDLAKFEQDYVRHYEAGLSKGIDVGQPFLLKPQRIKAGLVLAHGYLAAPLEVRKLAEFFCARGYAVYGVRLAGHGTSPANLAQVQWQDWYESYNRGYAIIKSLTDNIVVGGFSTGGCLAMIAAARKGFKVQAAFSICAPLQVRNYSMRLAPSIVTLNTMLKRIGANREGWEYVDNEPENRHINYTRNPLTGVRELIGVMDEMERLLPEVQVPALVVQGSRDSVVNPVSGQLIFGKLGARHKELTVFERDRHGIINGTGREDVFERVYQFLQRAPRHQAVHTETSEAAVI